MDEPTTREYAVKLACAAGCTVAEAADAISRVMEAFTKAMDTVADLCRSLAAAFEEIEATMEQRPPRSLRTLWEREKRRAYEQRIRAEIKRHDHTRIYRRVYKPP